MNENIYLPKIGVIRNIYPQTLDTSLLCVEFPENFDYLPGQFALLSVFGVGECPISITSTPYDKLLEFCIKGVGKVTEALVSLYEGDKIGIRGPFGNSFPIEKVKNKDLLFVAGGIGLAPLRSLINYLLKDRDNYGKIDILYGAKTPSELCFKKEFEFWRACKDVTLWLTVDKGDNDWKEYIGTVPEILEQLHPSPNKRIVFTCGPPIMIKFVLQVLQKLGYPDRNIITTLEMKMKCGIGKCGRCNIGDKYVCQDGPVFTLEELKKLPYEL
jgi:NAD(P)H-flavin reductase